jgi:hypothetical protein
MKAMPPKEPFWNALMNAIDTVKTKIGYGKVPSAAISETVSEHDIFRDEEITSDVMNILTREVGGRVWFAYQ